ncbi:MAG: 2-succinyl-5-enolpyruvyl-6-hydroxy-3-cyclohexene-1-carboxylic-acid synthase [Verrucomicrobia bacterium]|nr:2-succinyl-5-enolpyruvyl-6-hydroxy-3-cyclohexene-1-carboxylic-acid synthase [Verrucomicrobiota bacterium]
MNLDFRNTNALWCSVAAETLWQAGVRHAVISPGSRNTPLTLALVAHPGIATTPVLDERSAAFFGLGIAKRTGAPVVLLCTSGSAGAHYLPALIEARESGAPLIAITADRPPEMRDCASGQTIDQQKLFGSFVGFYHELAVPEPKVELLRYLRQTLRHAVTRAIADGPVHLNAPFRDPLPPISDGTAAALAGTVDWPVFFQVPDAPIPEPGATLELPAAFLASRGIVVAGGGWDDGAMARAFGAALGWPVLADALSGARFGAGDGETIIAGYDAILRSAHAAAVLRPEAVLVFGELPTSKVLRSWLAGVAAPTLHFSALAGNRDGLHGRTRSVHATPAKVKIPSLNPVVCAADWKRRWSQAEAAAQDVLRRIENDEPTFEGAFTRALSRTLERGQTLFVSSSMPVRDLEYFTPVRPSGPRIMANRGANGIDGILSTALGVAQGGEPVVLLTGDLALLHDTNGFLTASRLVGSLTIVVINNAGGGIFGHLPIAKFNPPFEEYWATPQTVDFARLAAAYGVAYEQVGNPAELSARLRAQVGEPGVRVIEVRTDRTQDVATRQKLFAAAAEAAGLSLV